MMRGRREIVVPEAFVAPKSNHHSEKHNNDSSNGQTEFVVSEGLKGLNGQLKFV